MMDVEEPLPKRSKPNPVEFDYAAALQLLDPERRDAGEFLPFPELKELLHESVEAERQRLQRSFEERPFETATTPLNDLILRAYVERGEESEASRFSRGGHALDRLEDAAPSLVVHLYPHGYSLNDRARHPYDTTSKDLLRAIDSQRLFSDLTDLLDEMPVTYHDGCLVIELQDERLPSRSDRGPVIRRVLLRPTAECLAHGLDLSADEMGVTMNDERRIEAERMLLMATAPSICLDPSVQVAQVASTINYNNQKFHVKRRRLTTKQRQDIERLEREEDIEGPGDFALLKFLNKQRKLGKPISSIQVDPLFYAQRKDLWRSQQVPRPPRNQLKEVQSEFPEVRRVCREVTFQKVLQRGGTNRSVGATTSCTLEVSANPTGVYMGSLRNVHGNTEIAYPLGNQLQTRRYIPQFKILYAREGHKCIADTGLPPGSIKQIDPSSYMAAPRHKSAARHRQGGRPSKHGPSGKAPLSGQGSPAKGKGGKETKKGRKRQKKAASSKKK